MKPSSLKLTKIGFSVGLGVSVISLSSKVWSEEQVLRENGVDWKKVEGNVYVPLPTTTERMSPWLLRILSAASAVYAGFNFLKILSSADLGILHNMNTILIFLGSVASHIFFFWMSFYDPFRREKEFVQMRKQVLSEPLLVAFKKYGISKTTEVATPLELRQKMRTELEEAAANLTASEKISYYLPYLRELVKRGLILESEANYFENFFSFDFHFRSEVNESRSEQVKQLLFLSRGIEQNLKHSYSKLHQVEKAVLVESRSERSSRVLVEENRKSLLLKLYQEDLERLKKKVSFDERASQILEAEVNVLTNLHNNLNSFFSDIMSRNESAIQSHCGPKYTPPSLLASLDITEEAKQEADSNTNTFSSEFSKMNGSSFFPSFKKNLWNFEKLEIVEPPKLSPPEPKSFLETISDFFGNLLK